MYFEAQRQLESVTRELASVEQQLKHQPEGKLVVCGRGKYTKWYKSINKEKEYLPKRNREEASELAHKAYLQERKKELEAEKKALVGYLESYDRIAFRSEKMLKEKKYGELLNHIFLQQAPEITEWLQEPYTSNPNYPEGLIFKTYAGHMVRSKSEVFISNSLYTHKIPYKYEFPLVLPQGVFHPDFTMMHPKTKKLWYYEHFGRMDEWSYIEKTTKKLEIYANNGIVIGKQLLATFETKSNPLDTNLVEDMLRYYFE